MNLNEAKELLENNGYLVESTNTTEIDCSNWHWIKSMSSYNNNYYYDTLSNDEFYLEECDEDYGDYLYYACDKSGKKIKYLGYTNREGSVENCNGKLVLDTSMPNLREAKESELDSIALKLFKGVSREECEEGAHQNESVNKAKMNNIIKENINMNLNEAKRVLRNYGYRLLDESRTYGVLVNSYNKGNKNIEGLEDEDINYFARKIQKQFDIPWQTATGLVISKLVSSGLLKQWKDGNADEADVYKTLCIYANKDKEERTRDNPQRWIDEVLDINPELEAQIEDDLFDFFDCYTDDSGMVYQRSVGSDSMADSVFDYLDSITYDDLVSEFGTPEQYVKG